MHGYCACTFLCLHWKHLATCATLCCGRCLEVSLTKPQESVVNFSGMPRSCPAHNSETSFRKRKPNSEGKDFMEPGLHCTMSWDCPLPDKTRITWTHSQECTPSSSWRWKVQHHSYHSKTNNFKASTMSTCARAFLILWNSFHDKMRTKDICIL